jgi:hypothetical protein
MIDVRVQRVIGGARQEALQRADGRIGIPGLRAHRDVRIGPDQADVAAVEAPGRIGLGRVRDRPQGCG